MSNVGRDEAERAVFALTQEVWPGMRMPVLEQASRMCGFGWSHVSRGYAETMEETVRVHVYWLVDVACRHDALDKLIAAIPVLRAWAKEPS